MGDTFISFLAIFLPFFFVMFILRHHFKMRERQMDLNLLQAQEGNNALEERVRVLEQIVTDNNPRLAQEIDALRTLPDTTATNGEAR